MECTSIRSGVGCRIEMASCYYQFTVKKTLRSSSSHETGKIVMPVMSSKRCTLLVLVGSAMATVSPCEEHPTGTQRSSQASACGSKRVSRGGNILGTSNRSINGTGHCRYAGTDVLSLVCTVPATEWYALHDR